MAKETSIKDNRLERILLYMTASAVGLSIACFIAVIIGTAAGVKDFGTPPWPTIIVLPTIGLPLGVAMMIALIIVSGIRRSREAKDTRR